MNSASVQMSSLIFEGASRCNTDSFPELLLALAKLCLSWSLSPSTSVGGAHSVLIFEKPLGEEDLYIREIVNYLHCEQGSVLFSASVYASAYFQRFLSVVIRLQSFPACSSTRNTGYDQFTPVSKRGRSKL